MSFYKTIDRQAGQRFSIAPRSGAEWLVGVGFRCWLAGYDTGDIACWENGWNAYAQALGTDPLLSARLLGWWDSDSTYLKNFFPWKWS